MVSTTGYLDGGSASIIMICSIIIGLYFVYKSKKLNAKLLSYAGLMIMSIGMLYLGPTCDFIFVFFNDSNIEPYGLRGILSYMWVPITVLLALFIGRNVLGIGKKLTVMLYIIYISTAIVFEVFLFLDAENAFIPPESITPGNLIDISFNYLHPTFMLLAFFLLSDLLILGVGFLMKSRGATGVIKRKFVFIALGFLIFGICGALDSLVEPGPLLVFVRVGMISSAFFFYSGLV